MSEKSYVVRDRIPLSPLRLLGHRGQPRTAGHLSHPRRSGHPAAAAEVLFGELDGRHAAVITDRTVAGLPADRITEALDERGLLLGSKIVDPGEKSKSLDTAYRLIDWLAEIGLARRDVVVALGGGMIMDTVGWVASAFMRGVPYINVPTTLLAQVDAGIGGKVAVDHNAAKNLVGAFYQPTGGYFLPGVPGDPRSSAGACRARRGIEKGDNRLPGTLRIHRAARRRTGATAIPRRSGRSSARPARSRPNSSAATRTRWTCAAR